MAQLSSPGGIDLAALQRPQSTVVVQQSQKWTVSPANAIFAPNRAGGHWSRVDWEIAVADGWIGTEVGELTEESAIEVLKNWLSLALQRSGGLSDIHAKTGIQKKRLVKIFSLHCQDVPLPNELVEISVASGYPAHDLAAQAAAYLCPPTLDTAHMAPEIELPIASRDSLKRWLCSARRNTPGGRLTQVELASRIGRSHLSIVAWENPKLRRIPKYKDICAIAEACGTGLPPIDLDALRGHVPSSELTRPASTSLNLYEEILFNGRLLSRRAHAPSRAERNALVFRARYGGQGEDESTLRAIGEVHGITRERIRQIVDKQLSFLGSTALETACFEAVVEACGGLRPVSVQEAEQQLRPLLGGALTLQGASDYGREVLGRPLPVQIVQISKGAPIVLPGHLPEWLPLAMTQSKAAIRHSGAAQLNLVWALTMRQLGGWIDPDEFRAVIAHVPGFDWIDDDQAWYWFGSDGGANRLLKRVFEILFNARGALDIEVIYGGVTRYSRNRSSAVAEDAGIWPPMEIVQRILAKSPALACQQGDDFRLAVTGQWASGKKGVAEAIVEELKVRSGLASRSELYQAMVVAKGVNAISFSVALAHSPLISQVDRGIFTIRGWPISAARLKEAQGSVGITSGPSINFREVSVTGLGDVSWVNTISPSSLMNLYAGVPSRASLHLLGGDYDAEGTTLTLVDSRIVGLIKLLVAKGGTAGTMYRVTANARIRTMSVEIIGSAEDELDDSD